MALPSNIHEVPFARLLAPLMCGIAAQTEWGVLPQRVWVLGLLPLAGLLLFAVRWTPQHGWGRTVYGLAVMLAMCCAGLTLVAASDLGDGLRPAQPIDVLVRIDDTPLRRVRSYRAEAMVEGQVNEAGQLLPMHERLLLYFGANDSAAAQLHHGDVLAMRIVPQPFARPSNPHQFDFAAYMRQRGIRLSAYVDSAQWRTVASRANPLKRLAFAMRDALLGVFDRAGLAHDELAVVSALTVGYKNLLDDELRRTYSAAGAMHILAVSGLHVGVIYGMLLLLLRLLPRCDRRIKLAISLALLWLFALITGLSPSVLRATAMFSLVELGRSLGYRTSSYNTLAAVAFGLLVVNPNNLYGMGFQLSFLAVLSIMVFYPHIRNLLYFKSKPLTWLWELLAVSVAAQIGTLPITLMNFGQFSNYFLLTNMLAMPMASVIIYLAVLLLAVAPVGPLFALVAKLLGMAVAMLNSGLRWIEALPHSLSTGLHCTVGQALLLLLAIVAMAQFLERKRLRLLNVALLSLCVFGGLYHLNRAVPDELVLFDLPRSSALCLSTNGRAFYFDTDTAQADIVERSSFYLSGYAEHRAQPRTSISLGCAHTPMPDGDELVVRRGYGLAVLQAGGLSVAMPYNDSCRRLAAPQPIEVDVLLVNRHANEAVLDLVRPRVAVFDASVWNNRLPRLAVRLLTRGVEVYDLQAYGAYRMPLPPPAESSPEP
ncbi:MAG: ComEC family competence protein [Bacteroidales bacterium]|nr:ComEC family competence protein [Bacteroidales bacterium]